MPPFGKQKSTCLQYRKQVLGELFGFGSGKLPFPLFNPSANQDNRKHSDHNHSGNPYGRKHPYPTPLNNSQQLQHNKDNRQNGYDTKPALFCFIIHNRPIRTGVGAERIVGQAVLAARTHLLQRLGVG